MSLMSYSGGLLYHWRAWRHAQGRWTSHLEGVRHWLQGWQPQTRHLVLIGPSGGYSLPKEWLTQFERVTVVDPDPIARAIWRSWGAQGHPKPSLRTLGRSDLIAGPDGDWRALREFLKPGDAVLFCNVLGQLEFLLTRTDAETRAYFQGLERALEGYEWASYHDRISGELTPSGASKSDHALTNEELLTRFSPGENTGRGEKSAGETILADHSTGQLAPSRARDYWIWELQPGRYHLIEGVKGKVEPPPT